MQYRGSNNGILCFTHFSFVITKITVERAVAVPSTVVRVLDCKSGGHVLKSHMVLTMFLLLSFPTFLLFNTQCNYSSPLRKRISTFDTIVQKRIPSGAASCKIVLSRTAYLKNVTDE